eukprot:gene1447-434_t
MIRLDSSLEVVEGEEGEAYRCLVDDPCDGRRSSAGALPSTAELSALALSFLSAVNRFVFDPNRVPGWQPGSSVVSMPAPWHQGSHSRDPFSAVYYTMHPGSMHPEQRFQMCAKHDKPRY